MKQLQARLTDLFKPPRPRVPDPQRKAREEAKRLAKAAGIEIERIGAGMNVWPPQAYKQPDPWEGDHYAQDWHEALDMVRTYACEAS